MFCVCDSLHVEQQNGSLQKGIVHLPAAGVDMCVNDFDYGKWKHRKNPTMDIITHMYYPERI